MFQMIQAKKTQVIIAVWQLQAMILLHNFFTALLSLTRFCVRTLFWKMHSRRIYKLNLPMCVHSECWLMTLILTVRFRFCQWHAKALHNRHLHHRHRLRFRRHCVLFLRMRKHYEPCYSTATKILECMLVLHKAQMWKVVLSRVAVIQCKLPILW